MSSAYQPGAWQTLYTVLGGSVAAIAGLLFIAMSLHIETIVRSPILRMRSRANIVGLIVLFTEAGVVLVPQPVAALGTEIFLMCLISLGGAIRLGMGFRRRRATILKRTLVFAGVWLFGAIGGLLLAYDLGEGMYLITAQYFATIALFFFNVWSIMIGVSETETSTGAS